jgi:hypothetical protein
VRSVGRPKKVQKSVSDQPAIHRFFNFGAAKNKSSAGPSKDNSTAKTTSTVETSDFIEDGDGDSDVSDEDVIEEKTDSQVLKKRKVMEHFWNVDYDSESDDDFSVEFETRTDTGKDNTEDIPVDSELGVACEGSVKDTGDTSNVSRDENYSVDLNHNSGRIVLKIHKS